jgi:16S rRNA (adenine1518-N6/adenine1519-N6)-dimethyltransferase
MSAAMSHQARKRFSQNFLRDPQIIEQIVRAINPQAGEQILEIGPGHGALTRPLLASGVELHMLEIDRDLAALLQLEFAHQENAHLHVGDALDQDFAAIANGRKFRVVGNLPYHISTPILFHVLQWSSMVNDMYFMLQREVVDRMAATPGNKNWGRLSIMCQYHFSVTRLFNVPPQAFTPAPKVQSSVVRLRPHEQPPVHIDSMEAFRKLVRQSFTMRRKTLRNCMRGLLQAEQIESAGIDPGLRPESLGLLEFATLSNLMD